MLQGPKISDDAWIHDVRIEDTDEGIDITIAVGTEEKTDVPIAEAKQDVYTRLGARPDSVVRVAMDQPSTRRILARTGEVAGYGWAAFSAAALDHPVTRLRRTVAVSLSNGLVSVEIDGATGTFSLDGVTGYGRLVDEGDLGDSYNYSPPRQDSVVDTPSSVTVRLDEQGPVRARARITAEYRWPDHIDGGSQARVGEHTVEVTTDVELRADEPVVRVTTSFVNPSGDHRLRVLLPLPEPADHSEAESAYAVVRRGLTAEGRADEFGLPTAPAHRFVSAGGLTVAHEGVTEYELIDVADDAAHTLALTVLRSTGHAVAPGHGLPALPGRAADAGRGPADAGQDGDLPLRAGRRVRRPLRAGRRRPVAARDGLEPRGRHAAGLGPRAGRARGAGRARCTGLAACSRCGSSTRRRNRPWSPSPGVRAGWSTCAVTRCARSRRPLN